MTPDSSKQLESTTVKAVSFSSDAEALEPAVILKQLEEFKESTQEQLNSLTASIRDVSIRVDDLTQDPRHARLKESATSFASSFSPSDDEAADSSNATDRARVDGSLNKKIDSGHLSATPSAAGDQSRRSSQSVKFVVPTASEQDVTSPDDSYARRLSSSSMHQRSSATPKSILRRSSTGTTSNTLSTTQTMAAASSSSVVGQASSAEGQSPSETQNLRSGRSWTPLQRNNTDESLLGSVYNAWDGGLDSRDLRKEMEEEEEASLSDTDPERRPLLPLAQREMNRRHTVFRQGSIVKSVSFPYRILGTLIGFITVVFIWEATDFAMRFFFTTRTIRLICYLLLASAASVMLIVSHQWVMWQVSKHGGTLLPSFAYALSTLFMAIGGWGILVTIVQIMVPEKAQFVCWVLGGVLLLFISMLYALHTHHNVILDIASCATTLGLDEEEEEALGVNYSGRRHSVARSPLTILKESSAPSRESSEASPESSAPRRGSAERPPYRESSAVSRRESVEGDSTFSC